MAERKLTTAEIIALARQQDSKGGGPAESAEQEASAAEEKPAAEASAASETSATTPAQQTATAQQTEVVSPPATFASRPKSTQDILAAARAEAQKGAAASSAPSGAAAKGAGASPEKKEVAAKPAGATPKSTQDILAAARAQAAGSKAQPAKASAEKPAAKAKPVAAGKAKAKEAVGGPKPSVQEMLRAVREGKPPEKAAPRKPVFPAKPVKAAGKKEPRRSFLWKLIGSPFALAWTAFTATSAIATLAMARFMMPNAIVEPPSKFKVGLPDDYPPGTVSTKWKSQFGVWIVHQEYKGQSEIYALASICTHLGCTPNWLEGEQKFKCPCHGSGFTPVGINFEGPAPRPLERYAIHIAPDGQLEVDKSMKFQEEMGQWDDPASFVATVV